MDRRLCYITVDDGVYKSWSAIGVQEDLVTDMDIAQFLVTLYWSLNQRDREECSIKCVHCHCPLTLYCNTCQRPSHLATPTQHPPPSLSSPPPALSSQVLPSSTHLPVLTHSAVSDVLRSNTTVVDVLQSATPVSEVRGEQEDGAALPPEAEGDDDSDFCSYDLDIVKTESSVSGCDQESKATKPIVNFRLMPSMGVHRRSTRISSRRKPDTASHQRKTQGRKKRSTTSNTHHSKVTKNKLADKKQSTAKNVVSEAQIKKIRKTRNDIPSYTEDVISRKSRDDSSSENKAEESSDDRTQRRPNQLPRKRKPCASQDLEEGHILPVDERCLAQIHVYDESFFERHKIEDKPPGRPGRPRKYAGSRISEESAPKKRGRKKQKRLCISQLTSDSETSDSDEEMSENQRCIALRSNQQISACKNTSNSTSSGKMTDTLDEKRLKSDPECLNQTEDDSETQPTVRVPGGESFSGGEDDGETDRPTFRILVSAQKILPLRTTNGNSAHKFYSYFECAHCQKAFIHKRAFNSHVQTHIDRKVYKCSFCDRSFERLCDQLIHERRHKYKCELCGYKYLEYSKIKEHMKLHAEKNDTIKCPGCTFETSNFEVFKKHKTICDSLRPILQCEICGVRLKSQRALSFHIAAIHRNDRPFKCSLCDKSFVLQTKLNTHIKDRHAEGGKRFHCDKCGYRSFHAQGLKIHQRCVHSSERPYKCTHCPSAFARKAYLTIHIRKHTGEKPHRCSECLQTFTQRPSLTRHIRSHHSVDASPNNKMKELQIPPVVSTEPADVSSSYC